MFVVAMMLLGGVVTATEFRSPLIGRTGPMRYVLEEWDEDDWGAKLWTSCYTRNTDKAFLSHGTNTHPLSALFFGKSCFSLSEALPGAYTTPGTEYYSPFVAVATLEPRISYEESGFSIGGRLAYAICNNKGRIGIRGRVPFRRIEIEREDLGDKYDDPLENLVTGEVVTRESITGAADIAKDVFTRAIRLDFLQALVYTANGDPILGFDSAGEAAITTNKAAWDLHLANPDNEITAVVQSPVGTLPRSPDRFLGIHQTPVTAPTTLPANGGVSDATQYAFWTGTDYTPLNIHTGTDAEKMAAKQRAAELWAISVHSPGQGGNSFTTKTDSMWTVIDHALKNYQQNVYAWLEDRGFEFASETRAGIGDIDVDLFYEHQLHDDIVGEVFAGVRIPTGSDNYCCNPYRPHLGNGNHWELSLGGLLAWQAATCINLKIDGRYSFVLSSEEKRPAAFVGACVKNIGPCVCANVDWDYFVGHIDLNFFHPKTDAISSLVGYEFYYKTTDSIRFKCSTLESWLGQIYNSTTEEWESNAGTLSSCVAEMHTQAIAHKICFETSFRITKWFELFCGATYVFAGKNVSRDADCHGGFVVSF